MAWTVKELIEHLGKLNPEAEVFYRASNGIGNISDIASLEESTYGFFGQSLPAIILDGYKDEETDCRDKY